MKMLSIVSHILLYLQEHKHKLQPYGARYY